MPEHIEIEKSIDRGELFRASKLFKKIRKVEFLIALFSPFLVVVPFLVMVLTTSYLIYYPIEPTNLSFYFIGFAMGYPLFIILLLVGIPRYTDKITDVNLLSSYYLFRIISSITHIPHFTTIK
jgi:hypothetical protein